MPYWFLNKKTKEPRIFGSLPVMCDAVPDIERKSLEYKFYKLKIEEFENDNFRIVKRDLERGGKTIKEKESIAPSI